jgi:hypothetical protein
MVPTDEDATNIAINKGLLFPNVGHKCLMAKDGKKKKVKSRASTKYTTSRVYTITFHTCRALAKVKKNFTTQCMQRTGHTNFRPGNFSSDKACTQLQSETSPGWVKRELMLMTSSGSD